MGNKIGNPRWRNTEAPSYYHWCSGKSISITYYECVFVVLVFQHAMRMRLITFCGLPRSTIFFSTSHERYELKKNCWTQDECFHFLHKFCLKYFFFILRRNEREIIKNVYCSSRKYPLFLSDLDETRLFPTDFWNIFKYQISWKSVKWQPSCSMRTDRRRDMKKLIVAFRKFAKSD